MANELKYRLRDPIEQFVADGKLMIGICNGFQVMVKAGLLPGFNIIKQPHGNNVFRPYLGV
ncbi:phosphoribosylformylglycinamidine synthase subunit PurQ, partial [Candidatus Poribacteria bacterium]